MPQTLSPIPVKVVYIGDEKTHEQYGASRSVLCVHVEHVAEDPTPDHWKYWLRYKPDQYGTIPAKGSDISIIKSGKGYSVVADGHAAGATQQGGPPAQATPQPKTAGPTFGSLLKLLRACVIETKECYESEEAQQKIAVTLFMKAVEVRAFPEPSPYQKVKDWLTNHITGEGCSLPVPKLLAALAKYRTEGHDKLPVVANLIFDAVVSRHEFAAGHLTSAVEALKGYADVLPPERLHVYQSALGERQTPDENVEDAF